MWILNWFKKHNFFSHTVKKSLNSQLALVQQFQSPFRTYIKKNDQEAIKTLLKQFTPVQNPPLCFTVNETLYHDAQSIISESGVGIIYRCDKQIHYYPLTAPYFDLVKAKQDVYQLLQLLSFHNPVLTGTHAKLLNFAQTALKNSTNPQQGLESYLNYRKNG